jgi:GNAT superfamily N-acetyltransferase
LIWAVASGSGMRDVFMGRIGGGMTDEIILRPAQPQDFAFCEPVYFSEMGWIIEALKLEPACHRDGFTRQWQCAEVRIIATESDDVGWLQTIPAGDVVFLGQLYLEGRFQRQGIGSRVMRLLIEEAASTKKAVALAVVKINPARRLYERLGFRVTHEDQHKLYMRRDPLMTA